MTLGGGVRASGDGDSGGAQSVDVSGELDSKIEWWLVHGRLAGDRLDEQSFMVSLFRAEIPDQTGRPVSAYSALISVLDARTGVQTTSSRVDQTALDALSRPDAARQIDQFSPEVVRDEFRRFGLPRELERPDAAPCLRAAPFDFQWSDLTLACDGEGTLTFRTKAEGFAPIQRRYPKSSFENTLIMTKPRNRMRQSGWLSSYPM
jgi:hypothetical protein